MPDIVTVLFVPKSALENVPVALDTTMLTASPDTTPENAADPVLMTAVVVES